ncbi:MAG: hypothetical protein J3R72DRAFT_461433 [Linnemannia gamsii]|nr:MAG: hypothetical protein J3R72DRAFT_461433 [Linnemannia gamsii]
MSSLPLAVASSFFSFTITQECNQTQPLFFATIHHHTHSTEFTRIRGWRRTRQDRTGQGRTGQDRTVPLLFFIFGMGPASFWSGDYDGGEGEESMRSRSVLPLEPKSDRGSC